MLSLAAGCTNYFQVVKHLNIKVSGFVQGVSFRYFAALKARKLKLAGFAQNQEDGSVYIEAEGEPSALDEFVAWCRRGPRFAQVDRVETSRGQVTGLSRFEVRL